MTKNEIVEYWSKCTPYKFDYLPQLGLVYSDDCKYGQLINEIVKNTSGLTKAKFGLPESIKEIILLNMTVATPDFLSIVSSRGDSDNIFRLYFYGKIDSSKIAREAEEFKSKISKVARVTTYYSVNIPDTISIFYKDITRIAKADSNIRTHLELNSNELKSLALLSGAESMEGFGYLYDNLNKLDSPILCYLDNHKVIGAIGPLKVEKDSHDRNRLLTPYFGVLDDYRKNGIGTKLWQGAMIWAFEKGADYILLQSKVGSPAEKFYKKNGLVIIGGISVRD